MAARLNRRHQDMVRAKISATKILTRLQKHVFGEVELTPAQVRSAEVLLRKCVPDLSAVELTGKDGNPIETVSKVEWTVVDPK